MPEKESGDKFVVTTDHNKKLSDEHKAHAVQPDGVMEYPSHSIPTKDTATGVTGSSDKAN